MTSAIDNSAAVARRDFELLHDSWSVHGRPVTSASKLGTTGQYETYSVHSNNEPTIFAVVCNGDSWRFLGSYLKALRSVAKDVHDCRDYRIIGLSGWGAVQ